MAAAELARIGGPEAVRRSVAAGRLIGVVKIKPGVAGSARLDEVERRLRGALAEIERNRLINVVSCCFPQHHATHRRHPRAL